MNSNSVRKEKIELIKNLLRGKKLGEVLPKIKVWLIEHEPGEYFVDIDSNHKKSIMVSEADGFIERLKSENKGKTVEVSIINHEEYKALSEKFELEY
ncbi:MAG: hypothetical protein JWQ09_2983 [Segetibacter sp.]|nr:hypothetical protein [Segetibacter sp.]